MKRLLFVVMLLATASRLQAQTKWYVQPAASGSGSSWSDAGDFQTMINGASSGDSVFVAEGIYQLASGQSFAMKDSVKIYGGFAGTESSLNQRNLAAGNNSTLSANNGTVFYNNDSLTTAALLDGFAITGGNGSYGGAIYNNASSPIITNCTFYNNSAYRSSGGAIYNTTSSPIITNCTFYNNNAYSYGGAIYNTTSSPIITNCTFYGNNTNRSDGGAIYNSLSSPIITNCTFYNNNASRGRGRGNSIYSSVSSPIITNCVFWGDLTENIINNVGIPIMTYCYTQESMSGTGNITGDKNPFADAATPMGIDGIWNTADDGLHLNYTANYFTTGLSPIDMGNNDSINHIGITTDIANTTRIQNTTVDMGAYEGGMFDEALPITLINFMGSLQNGLANLQWSSGEESSFSYFELQKTTAATFAHLATISARGSNSSYTHTVEQTETTAYYRLKMINNDGSSKYSNIIQLSQNSSSNILIYPNPAHNYINIKTPKAGIITIYNTSGTLVKKQTLQAGINTIDIQDLNTGTYYGVMNDARLNFIKE